MKTYTKAALKTDNLHTYYADLSQEELLDLEPSLEQEGLPEGLPEGLLEAEPELLDMEQEPELMLDMEQEPELLDTLGESGLKPKPKTKSVKAETKIPFAGKLTLSSTMCCGDCEGFDLLASVRYYGSVCSDHGYETESPACRFFTPKRPNHFVQSDAEMDALFSLAETLRSFPTENLKNILGLVWAERQNRSFGFSFMQEVFYRWRGTSTDNYVDNFVRCYVVTVTRKFISLCNRSATCAISVSLEDLLDGKNLVRNTELLLGNGPCLYTAEAFDRFVVPLLRGRKDKATADRMKRCYSKLKAGKDPDADRPKFVEETLRVDDLISMDYSTSDVKFTAKKLSTRKTSKVRDLVALTSSLSQLVSTDYYTEPEVTDGGLEEYTLSTDENDSDVE